jgi:hypothetical protein
MARGSWRGFSGTHTALLGQTRFAGFARILETGKMLLGAPCESLERLNSQRGPRPQRGPSREAGRARAHGGQRRTAGDPAPRESAAAERVVSPAELTGRGRCLLGSPAPPAVVRWRRRDTGSRLARMRRSLMSKFVARASTSVWLLVRTTLKGRSSGWGH